MARPFDTAGRPLVREHGRLRTLAKTVRVTAFATFATFALLCGACQPRENRADEAQRQVAEGNKCLARMNELEAELAKAGVFIREETDGGTYAYEIYSKARIERLDKKEVPDVKAKLAEYMKNAESVLRISRHPDVLLGRPERIQQNITNAKILVGAVAQRLEKLTLDPS